MVCTDRKYSVETGFIITKDELNYNNPEIQKQAVESVINVDKLANAFDSLNQAMDEISTFRRDSIPAMRNTVNKFKNLTEKATETILRMERGQNAKDNVILDVTALE